MRVLGVCGSLPARGYTGVAVWCLLFCLSGCARGCGATAETHGAPPVARELDERLAAALRAKGPDYVPRTRHKRPDGTPQFTNRLILEPSPYLLQHAHNPVDWFPWGEEAFARARALGRPIFLSVGYSTCHWCHVMEEESFEDEGLAKYLNEHYVPIKVDREERPDVDAVYMTFVQSLTGSGGWPMTVWLTPEREPFFGGTYFPLRAGSRGARRGLLELLAEQATRFADDPRGARAEAVRMADGLKTQTAPEPPGDFPGPAVLRAARDELARRFDPTWGGSRGAPKFPSFPTQLLLRVGRREHDGDATRMATETLEHMRAGGIHDHVGGGFHRYATDSKWLVPHFEKMLYDNALLARAYLDGFQASGRLRDRDTVIETLAYLAREMRAPDGTFYSATDADSADERGHRQEGAFFTWTEPELRAVLGDEDARLTAAWFGVTAAGHLDGRSVLHTERPESQVARELGVSEDVLLARIESARSRLYAARAKRPPPLRDEKVIVAWNGLAIAAFARAGMALGDARHAETAKAAASALVRTIAGGRVPHELVAGQSLGRGFSDDQACLAAALVDMFELTCDLAYLDLALALMETLEASFSDRANGGYFLQADDAEKLLLREKTSRDGPTPATGSVAALTWLRLYTLTGDEAHRRRAETTMRAFSRGLAARPLGLDQMLAALDWALDAPKEIVVVVPEGRGAMTPAARPLLDALGKSFVPNAILIVATEADLAGPIGERIPWAKNKTLRASVATAYVCENGSCQFPTNDPAVLGAQVREARPYR